MIPYLAQGANSSIEDGAVIGLILGKITSKSQLPQALRLYQSIRKPRGEEIARESLKIVRIFVITFKNESQFTDCQKKRNLYQMRDSPEQIRRDELLERYSDHKREIKERFDLCW